MKETEKNLPAVFGVVSSQKVIRRPGMDQKFRKSPADAMADFFGAKISNENTRQAYLRDAREFASWLSLQNLALNDVETLTVAHYRDYLVNDQGNSAATVKRKMSALRMLLGYMVETGSIGFNPAREVKTERVRAAGKTPALDPAQMRMLFDSFDPNKLIDLRDRALISVMAYSLARVSAAVGLRVSDFVDLGRQQVVRLHEKGGVERDIPAHPKLVEHLDAWLQASGFSGNSPLFPASLRKGTGFAFHPMTRGDVLRMVKRRLIAAGIPPVFSNHSFRATGITEFLTNGGSLEVAQQLANHADSRTTKLYDRRTTKLELQEIVRIRY